MLKKTKLPDKEAKANTIAALRLVLSELRGLVKITLAKIKQAKAPKKRRGPRTKVKAVPQGFKKALRPIP